MTVELKAKAKKSINLFLIYVTLHRNLMLEVKASS